MLKLRFKDVHVDFVVLANLKDDRQDLKGQVMLTRFALKKLDQIEVVHEVKDIPQVKEPVTKDELLF